MTRPAPVHARHMRPDAGPRLDPTRIAASSAAIAVHLIAFGLLLVPLAPRIAPIGDAVRMPVVWIEPKPEPVTEPPPEVPLEERLDKPAPTRPSRPDLPLRSDSPQHSAAPAIIAQAPASLPAAVGESIADSLPGTASPAIDAAAMPVGIALQYRVNPSPAYPREALRNQWQGTVVLRVLVDERGHPLEVTVESSSGQRVLDRAARDQVLRHWRFVPAQRDGRPIRAIGRVPVAFVLNG
ncbi:energy transducer TonB [Luteimonas sp. e5]